MPWNNMEVMLTLCDLRQRLCFGKIYIYSKNNPTSSGVASTLSVYGPRGTEVNQVLLIFKEIIQLITHI